MSDPNIQSGSSEQQNNFHANTSQTYYNGGAPVRCMRCNNIVSTRICGFCGLDLAPLYPSATTTPNQPTPASTTTQYAQASSYQQPPNNYQSYYQNNYAYTPSNRYQYQQALNTKKKSGLVVILGIVAAVIVFLYIVFLPIINFTTNTITRNYSVPGTPNIPNDDYTASIGDNSYPGGFSDIEFDKLKIGMSYAQISYILGGDGELVNEGIDLKDVPFFTYAWAKEDDSNIILYITFSEDAANDIMLGESEYGYGY